MNDNDLSRQLRAFGERAIDRGDVMNGSVLILAAETIDRQALIIGLLRSQIRVFGHIPMIVENAEVSLAELKMRAAARGN